MVCLEAQLAMFYLSWFDCKHVMLIQRFGQNVSAIKNKTINSFYMLKYFV